MKPLIEFGTEAQKARLLPKIAEGGLASLAITESGAGSDATGMKTRFTPEGEDILIEGSKVFITNGDVADRLLLFGKWSEIEDPRAAISALIFEKGTSGFEVVRTETKMGHRASSTAALSLQRLPGSAGEPPGRAGRGPADSAGLAQPLAAKRCRSCPRYC